MLKYYAEEEKRWARLQKAKPTERQVARTVRRWADKYFSAKSGKRSRLPFLLEFRVAKKGRLWSWSWATSSCIVLTTPVTWLVVAHEFAHLVQWRRGFKPRVWHGPYHRRLVDELCADLIKRGALSAG